jgi:predicted Zn-ribbon and HTH transcriptional regulator
MAEKLLRDSWNIDNVQMNLSNCIMDEQTLFKPLKAVLKTIRERADYALKQLEGVEEERSMRWQCKDCRYMKHFTRPVPLESAGKCPRCKSISFEAVA